MNTKEVTQGEFYAMVQTDLLGNPDKLADMKEKFELSFGTDRKTRTKEQWQNLVRVYGIDTVVQKEGLSKEVIESKCQ